MVFQAKEVVKDVYWVGARDWGVRNFHGYSTQDGTTYNAYLVLSDKNVLIDTVKEPFCDEMLERISSVIDPRKIDYIVSNHSELDHSGALPKAIEVIKPEKIFASPKGKDSLGAHFENVDVTSVKSGEDISLGNKTLSFQETKMLHWPESMVCYLKEQNILFSQDAFGMHLATSELFADEIRDDTLYREAGKYFGNIFTPLTGALKSRLKSMDSLDWDYSVIAPDHGPIWRKNPTTILDWYDAWLKALPVKRVVIVYGTMWQSTEKMARAICEGLISQGVKVKLMPVDGTDRSEIAYELMDAGGLLVGTPSLNNNIFPPVADVLAYLEGLKPKNLLVGAFGSYGWSPKVFEKVEASFKAMKASEIEERLAVNFVPDHSQMDLCQDYGVKFAKRLDKFCLSHQ